MATRLRIVPQWLDEAALGRALGAWRGGFAGAAGLFWRHPLPVLGCLLLALGLAAAYLAGSTPLYRATAMVELEGGAGGQDPGLEDQLRRIGSAEMAERLVERLGLQFLPEFRPEVAAGDGRTVPWLPPALLEWLPFGSAAAPTDQERAARLREHVVEAARSRTRVAVVRPMVLGVQFASAEPGLAAAGANALAELYVEERARRSAPPRDDAARAEEVAGLRASMDELDQAIEAARTSARAQSARREQAVRDLAGELAFWRRERGEVELRLRQAEAALASGAAPEPGALAMGADRLLGLEVREAELRARLASLAQEHGGDDPRVVELRAQVAGLEAERRSQLELIVSSLRQEAEIIRSRETALEAEIKNLEEASGPDAAGGNQPARLAELRAERERLRARLEQLEAQATPSLTAKIVAPAAAPGEPFRPRPAVVYAVALAGGLASGALLAFALE